MSDLQLIRAFGYENLPLDESQIYHLHHRLQQSAEKLKSTIYQVTRRHLDNKQFRRAEQCVERQRYSTHKKKVKLLRAYANVGDKVPKKEGASSLLFQDLKGPMS